MVVIVLGAGARGNVALAGNNAGAAFSLCPDTGQDKCYDNDGEIPCPAEGEPFYGQDAQYQGPQRSYTKLGYGGVELPDSATPADGWIMTRDNVTGLIWEIKTNKKDGFLDYTNPHDADNTYTWCDHNPDTNGGNQGTCGDRNDIEDFINALNAANFGGFSDWRLPTVKELSTLVNSGIPYPGPTIDTAYFPNTASYDYWSSTTIANYPNNNVWLVNFIGGDVYDYYKDHHYYVRAVRSGQAQAHFFVDNHNGTITDTATGLMWQKCTMGQAYNAATNSCDGAARTFNWQQALAECEGLELAGYDDWRLPNRNELQTIVDYSKYDPAINTTYFPNTMSYFPNTMSSAFVYWSSTSYAYHTSCALFVSFGHGGEVNFGSKGAHGGLMRCVRSGQGRSSSDLVTLTISKIGTGSGTVTSGDGNISCGSDCSETYDNGTTVTLTASPNAGSVFSGWSGGCSGTQISTTITMDTNKTCYARFDAVSGNLPVVSRCDVMVGDSLVSNPVFLDGVDLDVRFVPHIDWRGNTPSQIRYITPTGDFYGDQDGTITLNVGQAFGVGGKLQVVAVAQDGTESQPFEVPFDVAGPPYLSSNFFEFNYKKREYNSINLPLNILDLDVTDNIISADIPIWGGKRINVSLDSSSFLQ